MRFVFNGDKEIVVDFFHEDIVSNMLLAGKDYTENFPDLTALSGLSMFDTVEVYCGDTKIELNGNYNRIAGLTTDYNGDMLNITLRLDNYVMV